MTEKISLEANVREITGKHVRHSRRQGQIPAVVYGQGFENINIFVEALALKHVLAQAGSTHLIELNVGGKSIHTLAKKVQRHVLRGDLIHVDFYQVSLDRVIRAEIPVILIGESPIVKRKEAIVMHALGSLTIEALPATLPERIEVDMTQLENVGDHLLVSDLKIPGSVKILTPMDELVVKLDYAERREIEPSEIEGLTSAEPEVITARKLEESEES